MAVTARTRTLRERQRCMYFPPGSGQSLSGAIAIKKCGRGSLARPQGLLGCFQSWLGIARWEATACGTFIFPSGSGRNSGKGLGANSEERTRHREQKRDAEGAEKRKQEGG